MLVFWCCGRQAGDPLPQESAAQFGCQPRERAVAVVERLF
jgi:hypothetical protein